jgi:hypothetical protein
MQRKNTNAARRACKRCASERHAQLVPSRGALYQHAGGGRRHRDGQAHSTVHKERGTEGHVNHATAWRAITGAAALVTE